MFHGFKSIIVMINIQFLRVVIQLNQIHQFRVFIFFAIDAFLQSSSFRRFSDMADFISPISRVRLVLFMALVTLRSTIGSIFKFVFDGFTAVADTTFSIFSDFSGNQKVDSK